LTSQLINFDAYIEAVESDRLKPAILKEYQPNKIYYERAQKNAQGSLTFLKHWMNSDVQWLTLLGDYGVGKSWTLKRFLYQLIDEYKSDPTNARLPFYIPLQNFTKAFDFKNLILRTFQTNALGGIYYSTFEYLMMEGKIVFMLDSFDEMAQHLSRDVIRENLKELLFGLSNNSKAIMASRPNYFEGRAERLLVVEREGNIEWHTLDQMEYERMNALSRSIRDSLYRTKFARIQDLTIDQRKSLFRIVLGSNTPAYRKLIELLNRFQNLENLSQRAVIARLLTTVAETLADEKSTVAIDGDLLLPDNLEKINEAKIFQIVVHNLLHRDMNVGSLSASYRQAFLRNFALFLQRPGHDFFASPEEVRKLVQRLFAGDLRKTDSPEQLLESYYRTCRRHSGLTTEGQFKDTSGMIDMPVEELDTESRVGFSHNSLREYLIAEAIADKLEKGTDYLYINEVIVSDLVGDFLHSISEYKDGLLTQLNESFRSTDDDKFKELLFKAIYFFIRRSRERFVDLLGTPPLIDGIDLSALDLSGLSLRESSIYNCLALDTDFRKSDLRYASFDNTIIDNVMFDGALLSDSDFSMADITSIYVYDEYDLDTIAVLKGNLNP
jgi:hypothetical protein